MAQEGFIEVPGGRVWYRSVGEGGTPLLCLHGGPGFTHYYLEPLEALADRRQVIFYDQLGCGRSDRPDDVSLWTVDRFVEELAQVRAALGLSLAAPVRQFLGRDAGHAVRAGPAAGAGEPDPLRQPGQHDPVGQGLR